MPSSVNRDVAPSFVTCHPADKRGWWPITAVTACLGKTLQEGISFYKTPAHQELIKLRQPYSTWDFRVVEDEF